MATNSEQQIVRLALIGPVYPFRGGIAHYTTKLYQALNELGHDTFLISFKRQYPRWLFPGSSDRDPSNVPLAVGQAQYLIDSLNPLSWFRTFRAILAYQPNAMVMQWWTSFWFPAWLVLGMLCRRYLRGPLVYICHNVLPHEPRRWDLRLARLVLRWGDAFIVQSKQEKDRLLTLLPNASCTIVAHPTYDIFAEHLIPKQDARRLLRIPEGVATLLFFGIVRQYKGLEDLLAALPAIRSALGHVLLIVAGEFWDRKDRYEAQIDAMGISDSVMLIDRYIRNEEVGTLFSAVDLVVAPYRSATGSGAVKLAQGLGVPVLATDVCTDDDAGTPGIMTVPARNPVALSSAVRRFFSSRPAPLQRADDHRQGESWNRLAKEIERAAS